LVRDCPTPTSTEESVNQQRQQQQQEQQQQLLLSDARKLQQTISRVKSLGLDANEFAYIKALLLLKPGLFSLHLNSVSKLLISFNKQIVVV